MKTIRTVWWDGVPNYGDCLTPFLINEFGYQVKPVSYDKADLIMCGSVLSNIGPECSATIFGSGFVERGQSANLENCDVRALRGRLSHGIMGADTPVPHYGDPGILVSSPQVPLLYSVGVIPHYIDDGNMDIMRLVADSDNNATLIHSDTRDVRGYLARVQACEHIVSSSLHGWLAGIALGKPTAWIELSANVVGDGFKFADAADGLGLDPPARNKVDDKTSWRDLFGMGISHPAEQVGLKKIELAAALAEVLKAVAR